MDTTEVVLEAVELLKDDRAICGIAIRFAVSPSTETGSFSRRAGQGHGRSELLFMHDNTHPASCGETFQAVH